jgi:hypothetical protein
LRVFTIVLGLAAVGAGVAAAGAGEVSSPAGESDAPAASLVCPQCHTVNPPGAFFCMACGAQLAPREEKPWRRTPVTLAPELHVWYGSATAGVVTTYDGGKWGNEVALAAAYDFDYVKGGNLTDTIHFYFSQRRLRPFISVEPSVLIVDGHDSLGRLAVGGGARYGYGPYGSYMYAGVALAAIISEDDVNPGSLVHARLLHLFTPHVGIGGSINGLWWAGITVGPSFAF